LNKGNDQSIAGINSPKQYNNVYNYPNAQPNTLGSIEDQLHGQHYFFKWDANGNMIYQHEHQARSERFMCWDEENRLTTVKDERQMSAYLYDHAGERVWKMTGEVQSMSINGNMHIDQATLDRKTLYTNPYLIVTEAEYTKHYYAESQRIASKLGGGWAQAGYDPLQDHVAETPNFYYSELNNQLIDRLLLNAECVGVDAAEYYDAFEAVYNQLSEHEPEVNQYFYHPDHLGSSSFITNASGNVDQHLQYLPFGEPWIDQRTQNNIRFTFSGKERDEETGYNYFGARYYNSDVSIWLSVDPLSDKYPSLSPYTYCANNPLIIVDPDGRHLDVANEISGNWIINIVSPIYRDRITISNGKVSVNLEGLSEKQVKADKGLELISKMVNAEENYLYEVGDVAYMKNSTGKNQAFLISILDRNGVMNASDGGCDSRGQLSLLPSDGYNGQVSMSASGSWVDNEGKDARNSVIFHELAENYFRTTEKLDYQGNKRNGGFGAHYRSGQWEGNSYGNSKPGSADFNEPKFDRETRGILFYIAKDYNDNFK
jgi:RHS repeat-associated protein